MAAINEDDGISPTDEGENQHTKFKIFRGDETDPLGDTDNFPEFNWEHVRPWMAVRHAFRYSAKQINDLAAQDVVVFEKYNGHRTYGSVEAGTLDAAKRIKRVNPKVKIFFYLNAMCHYGGYAANKSWNEDWALRYENSNKLVKWRNRIISYDHRNLEFREWWINRALGMTKHDEIDGLFIDAICKVGHRRYCPPDHAEAYLATANELRSRLQPGKLLIGNAVRAAARGDYNLKHLRYLDGSYLEGWQQSRDTIRDTIELMSVMGKQGRIVMLTSSPMDMDRNVEAQIRETQSLQRRYNIVEDYIDFPLGVFLLGVEKWGYFTYKYGPPDAHPRRKNVIDPMKFKKVTNKLGKPMGDYVMEESYILSREFEHLKIRVDIEKREAVFTRKEQRDEL